MKLKIRQQMEREIALSVASQALGFGFAVSVNDGEETVLKYSKDINAIMDAMFSTDEDILKMYICHPCGEYTYLGFVQFIYGNTGYDVISDYTAIDEMETLLAIPHGLAEKLEKEYWYAKDGEGAPQIIQLSKEEAQVIANQLWEIGPSNVIAKSVLNKMGFILNLKKDRYQVSLDTYPDSDLRKREGLQCAYFVIEASSEDIAIADAKRMFPHAVFSSNAYKLEDAEEGMITNPKRY